MVGKSKLINQDVAALESGRYFLGAWTVSSRFSELILHFPHPIPSQFPMPPLPE